MAVRIISMVVRVMGPDMPGSTPEETDKLNQEVADGFQWSYLEDAGNDQLPENYFIKIDEA